MNDTLLDTQTPEEDTPAPITDVVESWRWSEGVEGEGDRPEWFNAKYDTVEKQAEGYNELSKKFGTFTGAPETYNVSFPENESGEPLGEFQDSDPMISSFQEIASEMGMNQEGFSKLLHAYVGWQIDGEEALRAQEVDALGENRDKRIKDVSDWGAANMSDEMYGDFKEMLSQARFVGVVEHLIGKTREIPIPADVKQASGVTQADIDARIADPKYRTDINFQKETTELIRKMVGSGEYNEVRG